MPEERERAGQREQAERRPGEEDADFADEHSQAGFTQPSDDDAHPSSVRREPESETGSSGQRAGSVRPSTLAGKGDN
jgi:hypothetical protein